MVDAERRNAVAAVEPRRALHDLRLLIRLPDHPLHGRQLEPPREQPRQPLAPQLRRVEVRHALDVPDERHVRNQRVDRAPAIFDITCYYYIRVKILSNERLTTWPEMLKSKLLVRC